MPAPRTITEAADLVDFSVTLDMSKASAPAPVLMRWLLKRLLRTFGVRVVRSRWNETESETK